MGYRIEFRTALAESRTIHPCRDERRFATLVDASRIARAEAGTMAIVHAVDVEARIYDRRGQLAHTFVAPTTARPGLATTG